MSDKNTTEHQQTAATAGHLKRVVIPEYTQGICQDGAAVLMDGVALTIDEIVELLNVNEQLLATRQRVLDAIPECKMHGADCVPHAIEWIKKMDHSGTLLLLLNDEYGLVDSWIGNGCEHDMVSSLLKIAQTKCAMMQKCTVFG